MKKKLITILLSLVMVLAMIPMTTGIAFATEPDYLYFTSNDSSNINVKIQKNNEGSTTLNVVLEYKIDDGSWTDFAIGGVGISVESGKKLYLRAKTTNTAFYQFIDYYNYCNYQFVLTGNVNSGGNVMSLLSNNLSTTTITSVKCFSDLFKDCTTLLTAPKLPATTLAEECYKNMFFGCTSLTAAPNLPATTLANNCYNSMFYGCTSLTQAPNLPATTLTDNCYNSMFSGCTSLITAPNLPATTLAYNCYNYMFYGCTSLTDAPALPATTLADYCYSIMFAGCTSLTQAPALPATTLADHCYNYMFYGCTSLTQAPALPATTLADYCYSNMFDGCTSLTAAPALPATTLNYACYTSMFRGCTSLTQASSLNAVTMISSCYANMFYGCTSLVAAPALPATTLAACCYENMFYGCTKLEISTEGMGTPQFTVPSGAASYMMSNMFDGVSLKGTGAIKTPTAGQTYYWQTPIEYPETWEPYYETLALKIAAQAEIEAAKMLEEAKVTVKEEPVVEEKVEIADVKSEQTVAPNGKNSVKVTWVDEKCEGYDIYRAANNEEYKFMFNTTNDYYYNTLIRAGQKYSYKVKGYKTVNGEKVYTDFSTETTCVVK